MTTQHTKYTQGVGVYWVSTCATNLVSTVESDLFTVTFVTFLGVTVTLCLLTVTTHIGYAHETGVYRHTEYGIQVFYDATFLVTAPTVGKSLVIQGSPHHITKYALHCADLVTV